MRTSLTLNTLSSPRSIAGSCSGTGTRRSISHICNVLTIPSVDASPAPAERGQGRNDSSSALNLAQQLLSFLTRSVQDTKHAEADLLATARVSPAVLADVGSHIRTASKSDVKTARLMSDLSNMAYDVSKVTASTLLHRHQLQLVSKSHPTDLTIPTNAGTTSELQSNIVPFPSSTSRRLVSNPSRPAVTEPKTSSLPIVQDPLQWFVADSTEEPLRVFAIQGSVSWDHWKINLAFEPVVFEDERLGVKVHRGVYETALQLYDTFLPYVLQHLNSHPNPQITFTGHSLGGSVATVLMLLYVSRGILPPSAVSPVHTYGAPAVFCDGATADGGHCSSCQLQCSGHARRPWSSCAGLLSAMDLPETAVRNIVMHNDIVPRAFVCDYSHVAQLLQRWGPAFKAHVGLSSQNPHKVLYNFLGTVHILQPDRRHKFVLGDEYHHLLPAYPALYTVHRDDPCDGCSPHNAVLHFMNNPHPLNVLQSAAAYGQEGSISRYHNPDNYTKALFGLLKRW